MTRRVMEELGAEECLRLLASVSLGRVVYTEKALPAIRPVNHIVDAGAVVIRSHLSGGLAKAVSSARGVVVAYEADSIDLDRRLGWSVVVTGVAQLVADPGEVDRYERMLRPWVDIAMDCVVRVQPQIVTGYRIVPARSAEETGADAA